MRIPNRTQYAYTAPTTAVFVELPAFERRRGQYLDDDGLRALQDLLMRNPVAGIPIQETGGLRKLRADLSPQDRRALKAMVKAEPEARRIV